MRKSRETKYFLTLCFCPPLCCSPPNLLLICLLFYPIAGFRDRVPVDQPPGTPTGGSDRFPVRLPVTCREQVYEEKYGIITSPDFLATIPDETKRGDQRMELCRWVLHATGKDGPQQISLYLTELYVRPPDGIVVTEHDTLPSPPWGDDYELEGEWRTTMESGQLGNRLGFFNAETTPEIPIIQTLKPYLVISFRPTILPSSNQVAQNLTFSQDLRGFNLTYKITSLTTDLSVDESYLPSQLCSHQTCSRSGRCLTTSDGSGSWCDCLDSGHTGSSCQYGPACSPRRQINPCANQDLCRYTSLNVVQCSCSANFTGERCETRRETPAQSCHDLNCTDRCTVTVDEIAKCECSPGRTLNRDGRTCSAIRKRSIRDTLGPPTWIRTVLKGPRGIVQTPGFPADFPTEFKYEWVLDLGYGRETVIYFTEIYLQLPAHLTVTGYDRYKDGNGIGARPLGVNLVDADKIEHKLDYDSYPDAGLVSNQPFVVIRMVIDGSHTMLRVKSHLLDQFGFNITYISYPPHTPPARRLQGCSGPFSCFFAGRCLVSADYTVAACHCFEGMLGENCRYGPKCNPMADPPVNLCLNGGQCAYSLGTETVGCSACPTGFTGLRCEKVDKRCPLKECSHTCAMNPSTKQYKCTCHPGFRLDPRNNKSCIDTGRRRLLIDLVLRNGTNVTTISTRFLSRLAGSAPKLDSCRLVKSTAASMTVLCRADKNMSDFVQRDAARIGRSQFFDSRDIWNTTITTFPVLDLLNITLFSPVPTVENSEMALVCLAQGSPNLSFSWSKDGLPFDPAANDGMWRTDMVLENGIKSCQINIENVGRPHQGVYTCHVEDHGEVTEQSQLVQVLRQPTVTILPATPFVQMGQSLAISCISSSPGATYRWTRKGEDIHSIPRHHSLKILPGVEPSDGGERLDGGMQLYIEQVSENADYMCSAVSTEKAELVVKVKVLSFVDPVCQPVFYRSVSWGLTLADNDNNQPCPYNMTGLAKRRCIMSKERGPEWTEPDFSDCISLRIQTIKTMVDTMQAGFGSRDSEMLRKSALNIKEFVEAQQPLFSRDVSAAIELLDILRSMATDSGVKDAVLEAYHADAWNVLQAEQKRDSRDNRFSLPQNQRVYLDGQRRNYELSGKFSCHPLSRSEVYINDTKVPRYNLNCPVVTLDNCSSCDWVHVTLALQVDGWATSSKLDIPEVIVTVTERMPVSGDASSIIGSDVVDLKIQSDPALAHYRAFMVFDLNLTDLATLETHKISTDSSVIRDMISCVEKPATTVEWVSDTCETKVFLTVPSAAASTAGTVNCRCRLSSVHTRYAFRIINNSTSRSGPSGFSSFVAPSYFMPVIIVGLIGFLILLGSALFCWQRKKILSCLLRFKKRTCDFVAENFRTSHHETTNLSEFPMTGRRSTEAVGKVQLDEVVTLVQPPSVPVTESDALR